MTRAQRLSLTTLALCAALPYAWLACGGSTPPPASPDDTASSASAGSASSADEASSAAPAAAAETSSPPADTTPSTPPAAPPLGQSDCGQCIDKTCAKPEASCSKNSDCQSMLDGFHGCGTDKGAAACLDAASLPSDKKPKKLAQAYAACAKKAIASKACKSKCQ